MVEDYLRLRGRFVVQGKIQGDSNEYSSVGILNLLAELERFGYTLSNDLMHDFLHLNDEDFINQSASLLKTVEALRGAMVEHEPFYPNFPAQVQAMSEEDLRRFAFVHYLGHEWGLSIRPQFVKEAREALREEVSLMVIERGSLEDYHSLMQSLMVRQSALSQADRWALLGWFMDFSDEFFLRLPDKIPNRETKALLLGKALWSHSLATVEHWARHWGYTATDILRMVVAHCGGDVSLKEPTRFKLSRSERRLVLSLLEAISELPSTLEDMFRHHERFKRLAECLHPHENKRFGGAMRLFEGLRGRYVSFEARWQGLWRSGDFQSALDCLAMRAGVMARQIDYLLRTAPNEEIRALVAKRFAQVKNDVPTRLLLQLWHHVSYRENPLPYRIFYPKGQVSKVWVEADKRKAWDKALCVAWAEALEGYLVERFSKLPHLGKVYLDDDLVNYAVSWRERSASKALQTMSYGSRVSIEPAHTLRFFIYWQQGRERVDVDLSAVFFDKDFNHLNTLAYYDLKHRYAVHSGDITSAPHGASEFIDVDWQSALEHGVRYVLLSVNSFSGQPYKDLPHCFAGIMLRKAPMAGEIFEPKTVQQRWDLSSDAQIALPLVVDLVEKRLIWLDLTLTRELSLSNNVFEHLGTMSMVVKAALEQPILSWQRLLTLHAKARGEICEEKSQADWLFSVTPPKNAKQQWFSPLQMDKWAMFTE
ncbi:MAG: TerD family protein [Cardiobacteriaceae bacterium]|nr:TerD family protein [Cardiobacteriaceae bacterium]